MKKIIIALGILLLVGCFFLFRYAREGLVIHGRANNLTSISDCIFDSGGSEIEYSVVITGDATLIFFSFKDAEYDLLNAVSGWEVVSLSEPPLARPHAEFSEKQRNYFKRRIGDEHDAILGLFARRDGISLQAYYNKKSGIFWGLIRGAKYINSHVNQAPPLDS